MVTTVCDKVISSESPVNQQLRCDYITSACNVCHVIAVQWWHLSRLRSLMKTERGLKALKSGCWVEIMLTHIEKPKLRMNLNAQDNVALIISLHQGKKNDKTRRQFHNYNIKPVYVERHGGISESLRLAKYFHIQYPVEVNYNNIKKI